MAKTIKRYSLFRCPFGLTAAPSDDTAYIVAARSHRQAYFLAGREIWWRDDVGILEKHLSDQVQHCNGVIDCDPWFEPSKVKPFDKQYIEDKLRYAVTPKSQEFAPDDESPAKATKVSNSCEYRTNSGVF